VTASSNPLAFTYPAAAEHRRHGPSGYSTYESYRPWLRDEFVFRCAYCLLRESWGRYTGEFDLDHFIPQTRDASRIADYENLVYCCHGSNSKREVSTFPTPNVI
jgi:5-methylcytosine-specific restriction endonuclease McrA